MFFGPQRLQNEGMVRIVFFNQEKCNFTARSVSAYHEKSHAEECVLEPYGEYNILNSALKRI